MSERLDWLTRERRRALLRGEPVYVPLSVEEAKLVIAGETHDLRIGREVAVTVTVMGAGKEGKKRFLRLRVLDHRPRNLRRLPPAQVITGGEAVTPQTEATAAEESSYTRRATDPLDCGEAVDAETQRKITIRANERDRARARNANPRAEDQEDIRRINAEMRELARRARAKGIEPISVLAPVADAVKRQHAELSEAA